MPRSKKSEPEKKTYRLNQSELEQIVIAHVAKMTGLEPPFVHTIEKDTARNELVITIEPVANVLPFQRGAG